MVSAGGAQAITASDGYFLLEGLPPGTHHLVVYSLDGTYRTFQQGATVAADSTTPAQIRITPAKMVNITFVVKVPNNTIPAVPMRMAGNIEQLGNTFADLTGGTSTIASRMPVMTLLPDGRYSLNVQLPAGADIHYLYTQGDGQWNAELSTDDLPHQRQFIVPDNPTIIEDNVDRWVSDQSGPITFDITVPADTPETDFVSIQFRPIYGWTEPIAMWPLGGNRWAFVLNSPLNLIGSVGYRFCRNDQCGAADDATTAGIDNPGYPLNPSLLPQTIVEKVDLWAWLNPPSVAVPSNPPSIAARGQTFLTGVQFQAAFHPSWTPQMPTILKDVGRLKGNWIVLSPAWTYTRGDPPVLEPVTGRDALWDDMEIAIHLSHQQGLKVALNPSAHTTIDWSVWWGTTKRDFNWWQVWFERYRQFALHHAELATRSQTEALILGGEWLAPALPDGKLPGGDSSGVPKDAEARWLNLIQEVRNRYTGPLYWAIPYDQFVNNPPAFLEKMDGVYLLWSTPLSDQVGAPQDVLQANAAKKLDDEILPMQAKFKKPIILGITYPSAVGAATGCLPNPDGGCLNWDHLAQPNPDIPSIEQDLQVQYDLYTALLTAVNSRGWINGFISTGYYPPAQLQDKSTSIHGKPVEDLLTYWFPRMLGNP